jgi:hypothetical protein
MPDRIFTIAQDIRNQCATIMGAIQDKRDATEARDDASRRDVAQRETVLAALAMTSRVNAWSESEIKKAVKMAASAKAANGGATDKTLATFIGEIKTACLPSVREFVPAIIAARDAAWDAETEALKVAKENKSDAPPAPLRKAFARAYHLLCRMLKEADAGNVLTEAEEVIAFAIANDPDHDAGKVKARLDKIVDTLRAFHEDFPVADIEVCVTALAHITEKELTRARDEARAAKLKADERGETTTVADNAHLKAPVTAPEPVQPAAGVYDYTMDDALEEMAA